MSSASPDRDWPDIAALRAEARRLLDLAIAAAAPEAAVRGALAACPPAPGPGGRLWLVAAGKAARAMAAAALAELPAPAGALVVTVRGSDAPLDGATVLAAGHPEPDAAGARAAERLEAMLAATAPGDVVLVLLSGGASALLPAPVAGLSLADKIAVNRLLLASGLGIEAVNLVRQNLSRLKGGGLLRAAAPARVETLILSDVIGDDPRAIASGPTAAPLGSAADARELLHRAGLWSRLPAAARAVLAAPPAARAGPPPPEARNRIVGSNATSLSAMQAAARWPARIVTGALTGDVAEAADRIGAAARAATSAQRPALLLFGGETTVRVTGDGLGGRNQELALRVALGNALPGAWAFLSAGTDGRDGPTDAAGGLVDAGTATRIAARGGDPAALLARNDSHRALALAGDLVVTGPTGTNVADVQVLALGAPA